jgi:DNA-binding NarL/FixJ family response regulator
MTEPRRILVIDDHPIFCMGLRRLLETQSDLRVAGTCPDRTSTLALLRTEPVDLVLVDISLGEQSGLELVRELRTLYPELPTLVLSMHEEGTFARPSLKAGAFGFVAKQADPDLLIEAIRSALAGRLALGPRTQTELFGRTAPEVWADDPMLGELSQREREVFELIGWGRTVREMAVLLDVAPKTVETLRRRIRDKTGLESTDELGRAAAAWVARTHGG